MLGHLKIPKGVTVVHADAGDGIVDPLSLKLAQAGDGLYFHIAVEGGKQTTETIPPRRASISICSRHELKFS